MLHVVYLGPIFEIAHNFKDDHAMLSRSSGSAISLSLNLIDVDLTKLRENIHKFWALIVYLVNCQQLDDSINSEDE